jgi:NAD(P)H-quinone oxidoreductase subunit 5
VILLNESVALTNSPWIVIAPFLVGAAIILLYPFHRHVWMKTLSMLLSVGAVAYGFAHSLCIFNDLRLTPALAPWQVNYDWFVSSSFKLATGVLVDNLAAVMLIVVTTVSFLVQIYTHGYMREDPGYCRFYAYLSLFTGSMLGLVVSTNLFEMYLFWELVGVCSYFLIGFWWYKNSAAAACLKAFLINRIGDFGFLVGILLLLAATYGFWQGSPILAFTDANGMDISGAIKWGVENGSITAASLTIIALLVFMGPMAKSAQAPLHVWLPDAMEGPTPISALIHAATMVAAGIYLVARAYPIWLTPGGSIDSPALAAVAWIGGLTAFMAATIAMSQNDIKRGLAWSTVSQLGYMFVGLGTGAYAAGMFHLFNHAFFKAMLFLCSGAVIHGLHGEQDMRQMGGLWKKMPITAVCFLIGTLSISGFPGMSGFFSKDPIIESAGQLTTGPMASLLGPLVTITAVMTSFYMFRMFFMTFLGKYRGTAHAHESPLVMTAPLMVLAVPSVVSGYLAPVFGHFLHFPGTKELESLLTPEALHTWLTSLAIFTSGCALAYAIYLRGWNINTKFKETLPAIYNFSFNKWYFDNLYMGILQKGILPVYKKMWSFVDMAIVDNLVNFTGLAAIGSGEVLKYTETGRGQYYAMVIFACVAGFSVFFYLSRPYWEKFLPF